MTIQHLTNLEILYGLFSLLAVAVSLFIGLKILLRYFMVHRYVFVTVGLSWIFMFSGWWGSAFSFLFLLFSDYEFSTFQYLFIANIFIPIALLLWIYSFCHLVYPHLKKLMVGIYGTICILFDVLIIFFLFTNPDLVGVIKGTFFMQPGLLVIAFLVFALLSALITGVIFSRKSIKSEEAKIRWQGWFLLSAFIIFILAAVIDALLPISPLIIVIVRILLAVSSISFYLGFHLPEKLASILAKKK
ncbi:MAG: hypothetical protein GF353_12205 [Candidatus Lokiarchaeota archaeon]|nr:hypothetical protein [Candidatus Lokiarchaeota archaeon]